MTSENPFSPAFARSTFLETVGGGEVLRRLDAGLGARESFLLLTGASGVGKTTLVHEAIARWDSRVTAAFLAYPMLTAMELLEEIVLRFGGEPADGASRPRLMACLERSLTNIAGRGQTAMIVVDAAHRLPPESLDELHLLVNAVQQARLSLEVLLIGSPELEALIEGPTLTALRERLSVRAKLEPLSPGETRRYLRHRVSVVGDDGATLFPRKVCLEVAALTGGVPRRINTLVGEALRIARDAEARTISLEHLRTATDTLAGTMPARVSDEPDDEESAPSPNLMDVIPDAKAKTPILVPESSLAPSMRSTPAAVEPTAHPPKRESAHSRLEMSFAEEADPPAPPASHDPDEWVSRFVGDQGPIQIGSQAMAMSASAVESEWEHEQQPASNAARPPTVDEAQPTPPSEERVQRWISHRNSTRVITYSLVAIAMFSVIALVIRVRLQTSEEKRQVLAGANTVGSRASVEAVSDPRRAAVINVASRRAVRDSVRSTRRYTLAVGEFSDLQAAFDERDRIHVLTRMDTWVVPASDSAGPHRIVLGVYRSPERAQNAARMLLRSRTLPAATVVALPKRGARQYRIRSPHRGAGTPPPAADSAQDRGVEAEPPAAPDL